MKRDRSALPEEIARRRVPCIISYLSPFRIVSVGAAPWSAAIEEVNGRSWDYASLHEMVGGIDVGLPRPYHMIVSRDGALGLPRVEGLMTDSEAVAYFNRCLAGLLIGGIYCEAIGTDGLDLGSIIDWKYLRSIGGGEATANRFHKQIRMRQASALDAIALHEPRTVSFEDVSTAMTLGLSLLNQVTRLRGDILLRGVTGLARRDWSAGLAYLWIVVEQLVGHLWDEHVLKSAKADKAPKARLDQLRDTRTWTAAVRLETLHQKAVIDAGTLAKISAARKARNDLSHEGVSPSQEAVLAAFAGIKALLRTALPGQAIPLFDLDLGDHSISDPFRPAGILKGEPKYWMEIPKLPGETELERAEASFWNKAEKVQKAEL